MRTVFCLDTYPLVEIFEGNQKFLWILKEPYVVPELTLAEFYGILYREKGVEEAKQWIQKLLPFAVQTSFSTLLKAVEFRHEQKKQNFSFFDAVGYLTAIQYNALFLTGDQAFKKMPHVKFIR